VRCAQSEKLWIFYSCARSPRIAHATFREEGGCRVLSAAPVVGHPRPTRRQVAARGAARAVDSAAWRGQIGPVAVTQRLGLRHSCLRGCGSLDGRAWMAGPVIGAVWRGVAAEPPCVRGRGPLEHCLGGVVGGHSGVYQQWGGVCVWLSAVVGRTRHLEDHTGSHIFPTTVFTPIPPPPTFFHPPHP